LDGDAPSIGSATLSLGRLDAIATMRAIKKSDPGWKVGEPEAIAVLQNSRGLSFFD
jgi:hypothetical protein